MSLKDIFQRNRAKQLDTEPEEGGDSELMAGNDAVRKKQLLYLGCGGAVALVLGSWYVMGDDAKLKPVGTDGKEVKITTDDMVNRNMSQREWQAASEAQMQSINNQLKGVDGQRAQMEQLQAMACVSSPSTSKAMPPQWQLPWYFIGVLRGHRGLAALSLMVGVHAGHGKLLQCYIRAFGL